MAPFLVRKKEVRKLRGGKSLNSPNSRPSHPARHESLYLLLLFTAGRQTSDCNGALCSEANLGGSWGVLQSLCGQLLHESATALRLYHASQGKAAQAAILMHTPTTVCRERPSSDPSHSGFRSVSIPILNSISA